MNALSWIIYAADVAGSLNTLTVVMGLGALIAGVLAFCFRDGGERDAWDTAMHDHKLYRTLYPNPPVGDRPAIGWPYRVHAKPLLIGAAIAFTVAVVTPAKDTLYAVAASQAGEAMLKSETGGKAIAALNAWLERQIK